MTIFQPNARLLRGGSAVDWSPEDRQKEFYRIYSRVLHEVGDRATVMEALAKRLGLKVSSVNTMLAKTAVNTIQPLSLDVLRFEEALADLARKQKKQQQAAIKGGKSK